MSKVSKFKDIIFYLITWGAIVLLGGITLISTLKSTPVTLTMPVYIGIVFLAIAAIIILALYRFDVITKINTTIFITLLLLIAVVPRVLWVYYVQTQPFSDFLHLHNYGVNASMGNFKEFVDFYAVFPFKFGFGFVLAGLYSLFGSGLMVAKIFNVALSLVLVILLYVGGKMLYGEKAGRLAALLCAVWPAQIMYSSVIAAENLFLVLFVSAILLIYRFFKKYTYSNYEVYNGNLLLFGIGAMTALAQLVRPMAMILLPVFAVYVLFFVRYRAEKVASFGLKIKSIAIVCICYFAVLNLVNLPIEKVTGVDVTQSGSGFNLLVGTNSKYHGMFNNDDFKIIEQYNYNFDEVHKAAKDIAIDRVVSEPIEFAKLAMTKVKILWGDENYGYYWSTISSLNSDTENVVKSHPRVFKGISQMFYFIIILLALGGCIYNLKEKKYEVLIILMIFGGMVLSYTFLEVQSRYHLPVMPLLILLGASFTSTKYSGKPFLSK